MYKFIKKVKQLVVSPPSIFADLTLVSMVIQQLNLEPSEVSMVIQQLNLEPLAVSMVIQGLSLVPLAVSQSNIKQSSIRQSSITILSIFTSKQVVEYVSPPKS